jgi:hypothetical protein
MLAALFYIVGKHFLLFLWSLHFPPGMQIYAEFTVAALWRKKQIAPLYLVRFKVSTELYHTPFLLQSMGW